MEVLNPQHLAELMATHPHYVAALLFTIVFLEALIAVGYLIPAGTVLFSAGALMASGTVSPQAAILGASLGAAAGSSVSYLAGARLSTRLERIWPFTRYPALLERNRRFVRRHGGKSVFLGRFTKALRPTVPAVAGMLGMSYRRFTFFNLSGCLAWSLVYLGIGFLLGSSAGFNPQQTIQLSAFLLTATLLFAMTAMMVRQRRARLAERPLDDDR
ncbi:MAG: DedA family protein [Ectothiorhodospiraceae bacterium]|nr:DedA family protein [Ectothiorhodospiraceae bacterium]